MCELGRQGSVEPVGREWLGPGLGAAPDPARHQARLAGHPHQKFEAGEGSLRVRHGLAMGLVVGLDLHPRAAGCGPLPRERGGICEIRIVSALEVPRQRVEVHPVEHDTLGSQVSREQGLTKAQRLAREQQQRDQDMRASERAISWAGVPPVRGLP